MIRSTFFGFEASKSAIFANQKALDIVGNNLANAKTEGYTRQRLETTATSYSASINRVAANMTGSAGAGITTLGVSQVRDQFIDKNYRGELSTSSYYGKAKDILTEIRDAIPDTNITSTAGFVGGLENIYTALNGYIQHPTYESEANIVKSSFAGMVQVLHDASNALDQVEARETADLNTTVNRVNEILLNIQINNRAIATEKNSLSTTDSAYFSPNELMDKQNLLLDELAQYTDIGVIQNPDKTFTVSLIDSSGHSVEVVNGKDSGSDPAILSMTSATDAATGKKTITFSLTDASGTSDIAFKSGAMKAYADVLTGDGSSGTVQGIPYYRSMLDSFAQQLVAVANGTIPEADANGEVQMDGDGNPVYKGLLGAKDPDTGLVDTSGTAKVTAANIAISAEWAADSSYFIFNKNENVEDYAQQLSTKLSGSEKTTFTFGGNNEKFEGNFENYVTTLVSKIGTDVNAATNSYTATKAVADSFLTQRESNSGVQRDEETANMLMYQKAYQASARMMTVMDNLLDMLINDLAARVS